MIHDPVNAELSPAIDHGPRGWRYASATPSGVAQPIEEEEMEREREREKRYKQKQSSLQNSSEAATVFVLHLIAKKSGIMWDLLL